MDTFLLAAAWLGISGLLGAFPTGVVLGSLYADVDPMSRGSGNIGATNMNRVLGRTYGVLTLAADVVKGLLPVLGAAALVDSPTYVGACGLLAFLGHCYSPFLDFRGGKGVATGGGVMLGVAPWPTFLAAVAWVVVVLATRKSSAGALVAVALLPVLCLFLAPQALLLALALGAGVVWRHQDNIRRLRTGGA